MFAARNQADESTNKFLGDEHSFDDYVREVRRYRRLADEILYKSIRVRPWRYCLMCVFLSLSVCLSVRLCLIDVFWRHLLRVKRYCAHIDPPAPGYPFRIYGKALRFLSMQQVEVYNWCVGGASGHF